MGAFRVPGPFKLRSIFARGTGETIGSQLHSTNEKSPADFSAGLFISLKIKLLDQAIAEYRLLV